MHATATLAAPFVPGERLDADRFLDRWEALTGLRRAELVNGSVVMPSPVGFEHGNEAGKIAFFLNLYEFATPGTNAVSDATVRLGDDDVPQPDAFLRIVEARGGASRIVGKILVGAPELVVEISDATAAFDLNEKLAMYEAAGVREYLVVLVETRSVRWFASERGRFVERFPDDAGVFRSTTFPGFWFAARDYVARRYDVVQATLAAGLATPEHAAFAQALAKGGSA